MKGSNLGSAFSSSITRRELLRAGLGGVALLAGGGALSGCGGGGFVGQGGNGEDRAAELFVSTFFGTTVERYDAATGAHRGTFVAGLRRSNGIVFVDREVLVVETIGDAVQRYDVATGAAKGAITGMNTAHDIVLGPDGNLYVPNAPSFPRLDKPGATPGPDDILRFDARTGAPLGVFATVPTPFAMAFGPAGDLYVSTVVEFGNNIPASDYITRIDGQTGASRGVFIPGLKHPYDMVFDRDGSVLVPEYFLGHIRRYSRTGAPLGEFARVANPIGLAWGPDGDLYVGSFSDAAGSPNTGSVQRFDGRSGAHRGSFVSGLPFVSYIAFR